MHTYIIIQHVNEPFWDNTSMLSLNTQNLKTETYRKLRRRWMATTGTPMSGNIDEKEMILPRSTLNFLQLGIKDAMWILY